MRGLRRRRQRHQGAWPGAGVMMVSNAVMPDQLGGLQRYVGELASAVMARGVPVTVLTKRVSADLPAREVAADGVEIRRFAIPRRENPLYAAAYPLASIAAVGRAVSGTGRVVHVHYPLQGFAPALLGSPYVHTFHAPIYRELLPERQDRYALPDRLGGPMVATARLGETVVARRSSAAIVLTEYMRGELARLAPRNAACATVIPGGINSEFFCPGPGIEHEVATGANPLLFTARRLVPRTGVGELVEAMPAVLSEFPGARLAIAGDGPLRGEIEALLRRLSLERSVTLLGRVSEQDLRGWYRAASLFVLPTQELEGFGISTMEALACGTPAIGTPVGGTPEILASIDSRLIAAGASPRELSAAILAIVRTEGLRESLAARVRARVVPEMDWSSIADRHLEIYERLALG